MGDIQGGDRLVEQQQARVLRQQHGYPGPLPLATSPRLGFCWRARIFSSVDFPEPFCPMRARSQP
ncbi:MAG TPA: hypothetical protein VHY36_05015 [Steroidobacteraceae bacterium]|nr:hypothetical protein [Steroidobacteraceae bacterium]